MDYVLPQKHYELLIRLMNHKTLFDVHDNCIQGSFRDMKSKLGVTMYAVESLIKTLRIEGLAKDVVDIYGVKRVMINPKFLYFHNYFEKRFHRTMFVLGSHEEAVKWLKLCRSHDRLYDPETGEDLGPFNAEQDLKYANSYSKNDRDKIHMRDGYSEDFYSSDVDAQILASKEEMKADKDCFEKWRETGEIDRSIFDGHSDTETD